MKSTGIKSRRVAASSSQALSASPTSPALATQLVDTLLTQQDRWDLLQTLSKAKQLLYIKTTTIDNFTDQLREDHAVLLKQAAAQLFGIPTQTEIAEVIALIEKTIQRFPIISLRLSYHPNRRQMKELLGFIRSNILPNALIDVTYDTSLVGGTVIQVNGKTIDLSLRETLRHAKI